MPSLPDGIVIFVLALLLFGPKKLPVLARELGKWIGEFRRASNEFKMQMSEELRVSEQADRQKEIAAMEAAAPVAPPLDGVPTTEPEHPHLPAIEHAAPAAPDTVAVEAAAPETTVLPIATSGALNIMPPASGLPVAQMPPPATDIQPLFDSIPESAPAESHSHG